MISLMIVGCFDIVEVVSAYSQLTCLIPILAIALATIDIVAVAIVALVMLGLFLLIELSKVKDQCQLA